jgi:hypothetical protein
MAVHVAYQTGKPTFVGVYACRVPTMSGLFEDIFLMWHDNEWSYLGSDQRYRDEVPYFLGPLQRRM